jgi:hypothetical protein
MTFMQAKPPQQPSRVAAVFRDAAISLKIAHQTTFAQLAELLSKLAEIHGELMCPVQVRVPAPAYVSRNRPRPQAVESMSHLSNRRPGVLIYH